MIRPLALLLALMSGGVAAAQTPPPPPPQPQTQPRLEAPRSGNPNRQPATRQQTRFRFAANALRNGNTAEAVRVLEELVAESPGNTSFVTKLADAYQAAGRPDDAVGLLQRTAGDSAAGLVRQGAVWADAGRMDDARAAWRRALDADGASPMTYRLVSEAQAEARLFAEAAETLEGGRLALGEDDLFALELANLYGFAGDFDRAGRMYAQVLVATPDAQRGVEGRLRSFLSGGGAPEAFARAVDDAMAEAPLNTALRETAAWLATERDDYDTAIDHVRAVDRLERGDGAKLVALARTARAAGALDAAGRALDDVLDRHPDGAQARGALLERARIALLRSDLDAERAGLPAPHADAARRTLARYLAGFAGDADGPQAALELGDLERTMYRELDRADSLYLIATRSRDAAVAGRALLARGEVAVARGDLYDARDRFVDVDEGLRIGPLAEQARYELARLDMYEGFPLSSLARVEALDNNTAADVTNDAIALGVTLRESLADGDSLNLHLGAYAQAELLHRRGLHQASIALLDSLDAAQPYHALADEQLVLRARALRAQGDSQAALDVLARLDDEHPSSFFRDRALVLMAEIAERDLNDAGTARDAWDRLLDLFPGSLYAPQARVELRRLTPTS